MLVAAQHHLAKAHEAVQHGAALPAAVLGHQVVRHLEVGERDDGLDAVAQQLVEHVVIKTQPRLVRLGLIPQREDARPGDGGAKTLEAHLGKQCDVVSVAVVEIHRLVVGVAMTGLNLVGDDALHPVGAAGEHIDDAEPLAALIPAPFYLVGGDRPPPQKVFR